MAKTNTTLSVAASATDGTVTLTAATGATVGGFLKMDDEYAFITAISGTVMTLTQRGSYGSTAKAHAILAPVCLGLTSDLVSVDYVMPRDVDFASIGADGAIAVPTRDTVFFINKGSALATSAMANPAPDQNGLRVTFVGATDFAHVVTLTTSGDGTTGNSATYTSAAFRGSSVTLVAYQGVWLVLSNNLFVIT